MPTITKTGILILSGGKSSRLGKPKQLLEINGKALISHIVQVAEEADLGQVMIVTGAYQEQINPLLKDQIIIKNKNWEEGMASSIREGIQYVKENYPDIDGLFILVIDQPYLHKSILHALYKEQQKENVIAVASRYNNQYGTPVLFHKDLWADLLSLKGDVGARKILRLLEDQIRSVPFEEGIFDLDTLEDYESFKARVSC